MIRTIKNLLTLAAISACCLPASAQKTEQPFLSIDGQAYYPRHFFNPYFEAYLQAEDKAALTPESFIERFADDILLLNQARIQGLDTLSSLKNATDNYARMMSSPYGIDRQALERFSREAAERSKEDVRVAHILVPVSPYAFEKDSLAARARIDSIAQALAAGTPFDTLARRINPNGTSGELGFVTVFQLPYALETAAYQTPVGQYSAPVRTRFGYHIVRPLERRPARGLAELSHILVMRKGTDSLDRQSLAEVREALSRLKKGEDFASVALNYTEDATTQAQGGYLGFYGIGELLPEIEDMVFALEAGQTTSIIALPDCWEIIRVNAKVQNDDYDARKEYLDRRVLADDRYLPARKAYAQSKLAAYPLDVDQAQYEKVVETLSNMGFLWGEWKNGYIENANQRLFTLADSVFTAGDFYNSLIYNMEAHDEHAELRQIVRDKFDDFVASTALGMYVRALPQTDPRIKSSVENFRNRSLIQILTNEYCKAQLEAVDPDTLRALYDRDTARYRWGQRAHFQVVMCRDAVTAEKVRQMMNSGMDYLEILSQLNKGLVSAADGAERTEETDKAFKPDFQIRKGVSDIVQEEDLYFVFNILDILPPSCKTFEQAEDLVRDDYLRLCADRYPASLRSAHQIEVFKKQLKALNKAVNAEKKKRGIE